MARFKCECGKSDDVTHGLLAIHQSIQNYEQHRVIWMDGRPHPSVNAPHTWMGFSTGVWAGNMLTVTTTHVKQGWHRRENIPASDEVTVIEHYIRHGNVLTHISVTEDPIYLAEPLIKSEEPEGVRGCFTLVGCGVKLAEAQL